MNHGLDSAGKPNEVKYKVQQILTRKNATLYTLTYMATEKQFDINAAEVAEIWGYTRFH